MAPHHLKFKGRSCTLSSQLIRFCILNNKKKKKKKKRMPKKHEHPIKKTDSVMLESLIGCLATQLEKSYVEHPNFHPL